MKRAAGEITVFLALVSMLIFSLFCTLIEGARTALLKNRTEQAIRSAMESAFAAYDRNAYSEYGLLMTEDDWLRRAETYIRCYLEPADGVADAAGDRLCLRELSGRETCAVRVTEANGAVFADAVLSYMKSAGMSILIQELMSRLGLDSEEDLSALLSSVRELLAENITLGGVLADYENIRDTAEEYRKMLEENPLPPSEEAGEDADPEEAETPDREAQALPVSDFMEKLSVLSEYGLTAFVTGDLELSRKSWADSELPSYLPSAEKRKNADFAEADFSLDEKLLLGEYALHKMDCYTRPRKGGFQYELEYVITGQKTEADALNRVTEYLLGIRTALNLAYLLTDSARTAEAEGAALALMSAIGVPYLAPAMKWVLTAAWALLEAASDLHILLGGGKVPLWKQSSDWKLAILSIDIAHTEGSRGLSYEDYLRLLFYMTGGEKAAYRMMDVIQQRIRLTREDFLLSDYVIRAEGSFTAQFDSVFFVIPPLKEVSPGGWKYTGKAVYGYERR